MNFSNLLQISGAPLPGPGALAPRARRWQDSRRQATKDVARVRTQRLARRAPVACLALAHGR